MAVRKSVEERVVVDGTRDAWLEKVRGALDAGGFKKVAADATLYQVTGEYKKATVVGEVLVTLLPSGTAQTEITIKSTANVDNAFALFKSPNKAIIEAVKSGLK